MIITSKMDLLKTTEKLTAIQKMQEISERLISNTPELAKRTIDLIKILTITPFSRKATRKGRNKSTLRKNSHPVTTWKSLIPQQENWRRQG